MLADVESEALYGASEFLHTFIVFQSLNLISLINVHLSSSLLHLSLCPPVLKDLPFLLHLLSKLFDSLSKDRLDFCLIHQIILLRGGFKCTLVEFIVLIGGVIIYQSSAIKKCWFFFGTCLDVELMFVLSYAWWYDGFFPLLDKAFLSYNTVLLQLISLIEEASLWSLLRLVLGEGSDSLVKDVPPVHILLPTWSFNWLQSLSHNELL